MPFTGVVLIIGAGPRIGRSVASRFASNGYKVALADLSGPDSVPSIFQTAGKAFSVPNIVVFNGANRLITPHDDPLLAPLGTINTARTVGFDSAYIAAQQALQGFRMLPTSTPTAFIYTGNTLNQIAIPGVMPFALGKVAAAMLVEYAANVYGKDSYSQEVYLLYLTCVSKFYFVDERKPDGRPAGLQIDGDAHADMFWTLAHEPKQSKWLVTFTKDGG
ncbi:hypothetical protein N7448_008997 [Penicillium atrosanguineum]|uniref:Uncharacterized protein n=1 Tax=Penicillium atrosanguineum TaxID=1132637 RepID=A0A9W9U641_9EURO|nr:Peroxisomal 2-4-dienoyl-CoA reductase [Penicillium atrosanguineum]KAJ5122900.1 hypothetical protein N7448_008997 [Penicillium atrosanguineum]KAJ5137200.1 hypothetical protein N7526_003433 [Penicillium atrosanguineum]KAJ5298123.1 Peroxisomal 2-4-dienoyl-CoA reductase [Penicillium atrosanguineum]KAJ5321607.1 hypothetical protein N7476_004609 [Penicillium atrosanguineum]